MIFQMDNRERHPHRLEVKSTRRSFVSQAVVTGALSLLAGGIVERTVKPFGSKNKKQKTASTEPLPPQVREQVIDRHAEINKILSVVPYVKAEVTNSETGEIELADVFNPDRAILEQNFVDSAHSLEDIDQALSVVVDMDYRARLRDKRYAIRQEGSSRLTPLSETQTLWADQYGIHPEVLGTCIDAYTRARAIVEKLGNARLRVENQFDTPDQVLINPGGMAKLMEWETTGYINAGGGLAMELINREEFPGAPEALMSLCEKTSRDTGYSYDAANIAGSVARTEGDISGGAIGPQFMPNNALRMYDLCRIGGESLNMFNPEDGTVAAYVFLALEEKVDPSGGGSKVNNLRFGYMRGEEYEQNRIDALEKWNNDKDEINAVLGSANSYYDTFLDS